MAELMSNRAVEDAAVQHVLAIEHHAGRLAIDTRGSPSALADIEGDRLIEIKAYGRSSRGTDLWLETRQVQAALAEPDRFHLVIVENIMQGDPNKYVVLDLHGQTLARLLERRRERHYFEIPFPTARYDELRRGLDAEASETSESPQD